MADILSVRDEYRAQIWAMLIQECKASEMTNKDFCPHQGVSEENFYYWQPELREQAIDTSAPNMLPLDPASEPEELLHIRFREAELTLLAKVDMDAVSVLLRSIQGL